MSGWSGRGEAISGVRDVDGGTRQSGSTNVEGRPGPGPGRRTDHHLAPGDQAGPRDVGQLGPRPLVSVGRAGVGPSTLTTTVGGWSVTHRHLTLSMSLLGPRLTINWGQYN